MTETLLRVDGRQVAYRRDGRGPALVLLHGDGESNRGWHGVLPALARSHDVIAPDLPGYGRSAPLAHPSPERLAASVLELLDHLGIGGAAFVGNSLGGLVAAHVARAAPARVTALVLADAAGLGVAANPALVIGALPGLGELNIAVAGAPFTAAARVEARRLLLFSDPLRAPGWWREDMRRLTRPGVVATSVAVRRLTLAPWGQQRVILGALGEIEAPTLVVWGERDQVFPTAQGRAAAARLPRGRLSIVPDCGHLPHVERPERFLAEVGPFLVAAPPPKPPAPGEERPIAGPAHP